MRKDLKKLIKFLLITLVILAIAFIVFIFWVGIGITNPGRMSDLEDEGSVVSLLVDCKEMLMAENAWNPSVDYNYVYYFKSGRCPSPDKLQNVEQVQKEFCDRVAKEDQRLYNLYVNRDKICPLVPSNQYPNQGN